MTVAPADLVAFRKSVQQLTGIVSAADVGIVGDGAHQKTGGYHEGRDVLTANGFYHVTALAGSAGEDYSVRLARDRQGLTNSASAMDISAAWPSGGVVAWQRFCALFVAALKADAPALGAVRAVNADTGSGMRRYDRQSGWSAQSTSDAGHIHIEWYRDTEGNRQGCLSAIAALIAQATGDDMPLTADEHAELIEGNLTPVNVLHYRLRSILDGEDPALTQYFNKGWNKSVGLRQLADKVDALASKPTAAVDAAALGAQLASDSTFINAIAGAMAQQIRGIVDDVVEARLDGATTVLSTAGPHST